MTEHHIYVSTNYVLRTIKENMGIDKTSGEELLDVIVYPHDSKPNEGYIVHSYEELVQLLKDYDKVWNFYEVETAGLVRAYNVIREQ